MGVRPKKYLGQHFLTNKEIARRIVDALEVVDGAKVLEIGPGKGVLTDFLVRKNINLQLVEIDLESVDYLKSRYPALELKIIPKDFLATDISGLFPSGNLHLIGNFPYNISSQIFFKVLESRNLVDQVVCMIQKEVARRITAGPGSRTYGILSVLLQAFYNVEYLFTVKPGSFYPPPKVNSSVIRMKRNQVAYLNCDETLFFRVVKQGFQNRRKTLRNALKPLNLPDSIKDYPILDLRAEALGVKEFVELTNKVQREWNP